MDQEAQAVSDEELIELGRKELERRRAVSEGQRRRWDRTRTLIAKGEEAERRETQGEGGEE